MSLVLWIAVPLLVLWAMFFALVARSFRHLSHHQLEELAQQTGKLESYQKHLPNYDLMQLAAGALAVLLEGALFILVVILLFNFTGAIEAWSTVGEMVGVVVLVALVCEGLPDRVARFHAERIVLKVSPLMAVIAIPFKPIYGLDRWLDAFFHGATDEDEEETNVQEVTDEILSAVTEGEQSGALDDDAGQMIEGVISLGQADVAEVMTPRTEIAGIDSKATLEDALETALAEGHSRLPVYESNLDNIVGIVLLKDMVAQLRPACPAGRGDDAKSLHNLMRSAYFIPETKTVSELLRELQKQKIQVAIVLDEYGGTAGLVSIEDILEEIVGEITDEHDHGEVPPLEQIDEVTVEVGPRCDIEQLNEALGLELPEDPEYDTVVGFVLHVLGRIPRLGEELDACGAHFEVLQADVRSVGRLRIRKLPDKSLSE